jgi:Mg2+-importing ATPase
VDPEVEAEPARWDVHSIERFMLLFGPISSIFDYVTFGLLLWLVGATDASAKAFHSGWFVESLFTQILVVLVIRTRRSPFWRSRPSPQLAAAIAAALFVAVVIVVVIPMSQVGRDLLGFDPLPLAFWPLLIVVTAAYLVLVETAKYFFNRRFGASAPIGAAAGK